jgi:dihydrofolate reductase
MGKVVSHMTMSLDGFIADPHDGVSELFGWYEAGTQTVPSANDHVLFTVDEGSAQLLREVVAVAGALVCGRRLFEHTSGWGDRHPIGAPVVVVTHQLPDDAGNWQTITFAGSVETPGAWRAGSPMPGRSPGTRTLLSPAPASPPRHWTWA